MYAFDAIPAGRGGNDGPSGLRLQRRIAMRHGSFATPRSMRAGRS
jgi:hypothetical protein